MGNKCNKQRSESEALRERIGICPAEVNRRLKEQRKVYEKKCQEYVAKARQNTGTAVTAQAETTLAPQDVETAQEAFLWCIKLPAQNTQAAQTKHTTQNAQATQSAHSRQSTQAMHYISFPVQNAQRMLYTQSAENAHATQAAIRAQIPDLQAIQSSLEHVRNAFHMQITNNVPPTKSAQTAHPIPNAKAAQTAHHLEPTNAQRKLNVQSAEIAHAKQSAIRAQIPDPQATQSSLEQLPNALHVQTTNNVPATQSAQTAHPIPNVKAAQTAYNLQSTLHAHTTKNMLTAQETQVAHNVKTPQSSHEHLFTHKHSTHCTFTESAQIAPMQKTVALQMQPKKNSLAVQNKQIAQKLLIPQTSQAPLNEPTMQNAQTHEKPNMTQKVPLTNLPHSLVIYNSNWNSRDEALRNHNNTKHQWNCSTCEMRFGLEIYECNDHHSSCNDCKEEGRACGICGRAISTLKNSATQIFFNFNDRTKSPCPYSIEGCILSFRESEMGAHIQECPYQELPCPTECPSILRLKQLSSHFKAVHPKQSFIKVGTEVQLRDINKNSWNVYLVPVDKIRILFYVIVSTSNHKIYMTVQIVSTKYSALKWCYEIHVYNPNEGRSFKFVDNCSSYFEPVANIVKEGKCCVIPQAYASNLAREGVLTYKFFIKKSFGEN